MLRRCIKEWDEERDGKRNGGRQGGWEKGQKGRRETALEGTEGQ